MPKVQVLIFEGGECVSNDPSSDNNHINEIDSWCETDIRQAFIDYFGGDWENEDTSDMFEVPIKMPDTVSVLSDTFAQCITCGVDGGMTYLVRSSTK